MGRAFAGEVRRALRSAWCLGVAGAIGLCASAARAQSSPAAPASDTDLLMPVLPSSAPAVSAPAASAPAASTSASASAAPAAPAEAEAPAESEAASASAAPSTAAEVPPPVPLRASGKPQLPFVVDPTIKGWDDARASSNRWGTVGLVSAQFFVWPYLVSLVVGAVAIDCKSCGRDREVLAPLVLPVFGPLITAGLIKTPGNTGDAARGILIADSVLQGAGLALAIVALKTAQTSGGGVGASRPSFQVAPMASPSGGGLVVVGSF